MYMFSKQKLNVCVFPCICKYINCICDQLDPIYLYVYVKYLISSLLRKYSFLKFFKYINTIRKVSHELKHPTTYDLLT